jgi:hypothetical protein
VFIERAIAYARRAAGEIDVAEVSDESVREALLDEATAEFSVHWPLLRQHTLTLAAGASFYALPSPYIMGIESFEKTGVGTVTIEGFGTFQYQPVISGSDLAVAGGFPVIEECVTLEGDQLVVSPTPSGAGTMELLTRDLWNFEDSLTFTGTGAQTAFALDRGTVWAVHVFVDGEEQIRTTDDIIGDFTVNTAVNPVEVVFAVAPADGAAIEVRYQHSASYNTIPLRLQPSYRLLVAWQVALAAAERRARFSMVKVADDLIRPGSRQLRERAALLKREAIGRIHGHGIRMQQG